MHAAETTELSDVVPAALGYRMPAEWEPHQATWLIWPRPQCSSFIGRPFGSIERVWLEVAQRLCQHEAVHVATFDPMQQQRVAELLGARYGGRPGRGSQPEGEPAAEQPTGDQPRGYQPRGPAAAQRPAADQMGSAVRLATRPLHPVSVHVVPAYEPWCRDSGPVFVTRRVGLQAPLAIVDWSYNAWGGKYPPYELDNAVPGRIAELLGLGRFAGPMVLEGGAFDVNGCATLLTTESCLPNPNRNPGLDRAQIERYLADYLGITKVIWLVGGLAGDDTDGHVDNLARFVGPSTVVAAVEDDRSDHNFGPLKENLARLAKATDQDGRGLDVIELPMPRPVVIAGQRLPASYANFYVANGLVLVPQFDDRHDERAIELLAGLFPDRLVVGVPCRDLIWGRGAVHCMTLQCPAPVPLEP